MASLVSGLARGIELGMTMDRFKRERERAPVLEQQRDELHALTKQLTELKLDELRDARKRREALQSINAGLAAAETGDLNHPDVLNAVNTVYAPVINTGVGGDIVSKRVAGIVPVPGQEGKFAIELEVTKKDGTTYRAPWTKKRSADPTDTVEVFDLRDSLGDVLSTKELLERLESAALRYGDDKLMERRHKRKELELKHAQSLELESVKHKNRLGQIRELAKTGRGGSAALQHQRWQIDQLIEIGLPEDIARRAIILKENIPKTEILKIIARAKNERDKTMFPGQEGWMSDQEIESSVMGLVRRLQSTDTLRPGPKPAPPSPSSAAAPSAPISERIDPGAFGPASSMPRPAPEVVTLKPSYLAPNGRTVTRQEIEATAARRGFTSQQVIELLGLQ